MARTAVAAPASAAAAIALLVSVTGTAAAGDGVYVSEGFGVSRYDDELDNAVGDSAIHVRGAVGYRSGHVALELWVLAGLPIVAEGQPAARIDERPTRPSTGDPATYGLDAKVIQPLSAHWDAYARAGLSRMQLGDYDGNGVDAAAGVQLGGKVRALGFLWWPLFFVGKGPEIHAALWFEASTSFYRVHADGASAIDARMTGWTLGFSLGQGF